MSGKVTPGASWLTKDELKLSVFVLVFGTLVLALEYALLRRRNIKPDDILRVSAVTLILVGTLFVVTAGFDSKDVAPAMGLFGTIAGYLIGNRQRSPDTQEGTSNDS